ncbi:MAG: VOC family protein [Epulopiscium sp.]|nr:VOC family protein [Candidatus Epulonipiscium sp.]
MRFCWSTLRVKNMEESLKFYQEVVGLIVDKRFKAGPGMEIAFLGDGETKIELICNENSNDINIGRDISWGFEVNSVDEKISFLKERGIAIDEGPYQPNPHTKFFYIMDPNGLKIQFVENLQEETMVINKR